MDNGGAHYRSAKRIGYLIAALGFAILAMVAATPTRADYDGPVSPEIQAWFRTVKNAAGEYCCDGTEVAHVTDYQWRGDHFDVAVDGNVYHVKPDRVTKEPNRLGEPLAWFYPKYAERSDDTLRCFMQGTEG